MGLQQGKFLSFALSVSLLVGLIGSGAIPAVDPGGSLIDEGEGATASFSLISKKDSPLSRNATVLLKFTGGVFGMRRESINIKNGRLTSFVMRKDKKSGGMVREARFKVVPIFPKKEPSVAVSISLETKELSAALEGLPVKAPTPLIISFTKKKKPSRPTPSSHATATPVVDPAMTPVAVR